MAGLLLQFVVSFGHLHGRDATAAQRAVVSSILLADAGDDRFDATTLQQIAARDIQPRSSQEPADENCAICIVGHLIGSAHIAVPPAVPLPFAFGIAALPLWTEATIDELSHFAFQSRGPPHA